jgi:hypothetical protein
LSASSSTARARRELPVVYCAFSFLSTRLFDDGKRIATVQDLTVNDEVKVQRFVRKLLE